MTTTTTTALMMDSDIEIMCNNVMQANEYKNSSVAKERKLTNRKQYDKQRILDAKVGAINATEFSGQTSPTIRPMTEVEAFPLKKTIRSTIKTFFFYALLRKPIFVAFDFMS